MRQPAGDLGQEAGYDEYGSFERQEPDADEVHESYRIEAPTQRHRRGMPAPRRQQDLDATEYDEEVEEEDVEPAPIRRPTRRPATSGQRRAARSTRSTRIEPQYDDELYNDDPYLGYDDDTEWNEPATVPTVRRSPRQSSRSPRPAMPSVRVPHAISEAAVLGDRTTLLLFGLGLVSLVSMAIAVSTGIDSITAMIPTHVSASGVAEDIRTRDAIWRIPLMVGMLGLMAAIASWFIAPLDRFASRVVQAGWLTTSIIAWIALLKYLNP